MVTSALRRTGPRRCRWRAARLGPGAGRPEAIGQGPTL